MRGYGTDSARKYLGGGVVPNKECPEKPRLRGTYRTTSRFPPLRNRVAQANLRRALALGFPPAATGTPSLGTRSIRLLGTAVTLQAREPRVKRISKISFRTRRTVADARRAVPFKD